MTKLHIIYIPGLGDDNPKNQELVVRTWKWWGVDSELFQMNWADDEVWQIKFNRLLARIDEIAATKKQVALVGASAGASAVINAFAARSTSVAGVVCICGKINHPEDIGSKYRQANPSFVESAYNAPNSLKKLDTTYRKKVLSRYALFDETVRRRDSVIEGARNRTIFTAGHYITIAIQLLFGAPSFIRFLKKRI